MTVSLTAKHDISKTDDNDNETCRTNNKQDCDHTDSLLENLSSSDEKGKSDEVDNGEMNGEADGDLKKTKNNNDDNIVSEKAKLLLTFDEAPNYMKHNSYILSGYRGILNTRLCLESIFWWTNETINIWSHIFGFLLFTTAALRDLLVLRVHMRLGDKIIIGCVLICFQACMIFSSLYHTFSCRSERDCDIFLSFDLFGIALSLFAIYTSGIYYAFWCNPDLQNFYMVTITLIFIIAMMMQYPKFKINANVKMLVFVAWAAYGVLPTFHWTIVMGGFENPVVALLFPRVIGMYVISGIAFLIYITKVPERFYSGKFDYFGHSHQWWHLFVVGALYYWHNSGLLYLDYRLNHACASHMTII